MAHAGARGPQGDPGWAEAAAQARLDRDEAARQHDEDAHARLQQFHELVKREGPLFVQRVSAELQAAVRAFNERLGSAALAYDVSPGGALSIRSARDGRSIVIAPDLNTDEGNEAGAMVSVDDGRRSTRPFLFGREGEQLCLCGAGLAFTAAAFVRYVVESWLLELPLGARMP